MPHYSADPPLSSYFPMNVCEDIKLTAIIVFEPTFTNTVDPSFVLYIPASEIPFVQSCDYLLSYWISGDHQSLDIRVGKQLGHLHPLILGFLAGLALDCGLGEYQYIEKPK